MILLQIPDDGSCTFCTNGTSFTNITVSDSSYTWNNTTYTQSGTYFHVVTPTTFSVGDFVQGGVVFWVNPNDSAKGLVCAISESVSLMNWGCIGANIPGANGTAIGTGEQNTLDIINKL